jgi:hypothetical protein
MNQMKMDYILEEVEFQFISMTDFGSFATEFRFLFWNLMGIFAMCIRVESPFL